MVDGDTDGSARTERSAGRGVGDWLLALVSCEDAPTAPVLLGSLPVGGGCAGGREARRRKGACTELGPDSAETPGRFSGR